jgi:hypothetical protein
VTCVFITYNATSFNATTRANKRSIEDCTGRMSDSRAPVRLRMGFYFDAVGLTDGRQNSKNHTPLAMPSQRLRAAFGSFAAKAGLGPVRLIGS